MFFIARRDYSCYNCGKTGEVYVANVVDASENNGKPFAITMCENCIEKYFQVAYETRKIILAHSSP